MSRLQTWLDSVDGARRIAKVVALAGLAAFVGQSLLVGAHYLESLGGVTPTWYSISALVLVAIVAWALLELSSYIIDLTGASVAS